MPDFTIDFHRFERRCGRKHEALYEALKDAIHSGMIRKNGRLPSTRRLAQLYGFSRGTVQLAYEMLWADGYLRTQRGSGTFVDIAEPIKKSRVRAPAQPALSPWARRLTDTAEPLVGPVPAGQLHFRLGYSDFARFPAKEWQQCLREGLRAVGYSLRSASADVAGLPALREGVATHLRLTRGIDVTAEEVVITNGSAQAVALLMQLLVGSGDRVVVENPSYFGMRSAVIASGGRCIPAALDDHGLVVSDWNSRLAFVTPGAQYPTGIVTRLDRRLALLEWASKRNAFVIEDDFDVEFRRRGRPLEPLKALDREDRVIYISTFSKTIAPALRLGYAIVPATLQPKLLAAKRLYEPISSSLMEQSGLALFMKYGHFTRHLKRMKRIYAEKHGRFAAATEAELGGAFDWTDAELGLHRFGWWNHSERRLRALTKACADAGVIWDSPENNFLRNPRPAVMWGFSHLATGEMERAIGIVAREYRRVV